MDRVGNKDNRKEKKKNRKKSKIWKQGNRKIMKKENRKIGKQENIDMEIRTEEEKQENRIILIGK